MHAFHKLYLLILPILTTILCACGTQTIRMASPVPQIHSGVAHSCLLTQQGQVLCWGQGAQQDSALSPDQFGRPLLIQDLEAVSLAAGWYHTCAATLAGHVKCWGQNTNGQLGDGTGTDSSMPVDVKGIERVGTVSAGAMHTCALTKTGEVYCWGGNSQGQLGDGTETDGLEPVRVKGLTGPASGISAGLSYTCAVLTSGGVECWGQLPFFPEEQRDQVQLAPVPVPGLEKDVEKMATGDYHLCILTSSKEVKCEGNFFATGTPLFSQPVDALGDMQGHIRDLIAQTDFTCVLTDASEVYCWGDNYFDQIGDGTFLTAAEPKRVDRAGSQVIALGGGHYTACALLEDGGVTCWGDTSFGQLGDGSARWK